MPQTNSKVKQQTAKKGKAKEPSNDGAQSANPQAHQPKITWMMESIMQHALWTDDVNKWLLNKISDEELDEKQKMYIKSIELMLKYFKDYKKLNYVKAE